MRRANATGFFSCAKAGWEAKFNSRQRFCLTASVIGWMLCATMALQARGSPTEYDVKAAYLYQFGKFVEWPEGTMTHTGNIFMICVLGTDPFGSILDETIAGRSVQGSHVAVKRITNTDAALGCNILFISSSEQHHASEVLKSLQGKSILTVAESKSFLPQGGMICFRMEEDKVRFEINLSAVASANLKVSSQLLKVAALLRN